MAMTARTCSNCGYPVDPSFVFCLNCGQMLGEDTGASSEAPGAFNGQATGTGMGYEDDGFGTGTGTGTGMGYAPNQDIYGQGQGTGSGMGSFGAYDQPATGSDGYAPRPTVVDGFCRECGSKTRAGWVYCLNCGTALMPENDSYLKNDLSRYGGGLSPVPAMATIQPGGLGEQPGGMGGMGYANDVPTGTGWNAQGGLGDDVTEVYDGPEDEVTMVYDDAPTLSCALNRVATNERLALKLPCTVGRGSKADVRVGGNPYIGRVHVSLSAEGDKLRVVDEGSANHTYVNGSQLMPGEPVTLHDGDTLTLAKEDFIVVIS